MRSRRFKPKKSQANKTCVWSKGDLGTYVIMYVCGREITLGPETRTESHVMGVKDKGEGEDDQLLYRAK